MIVLWDAEEQARRPLSDYGSAFLKALADIAAISTGTRRPISVWDVNARASPAPPAADNRVRVDLEGCPNSCPSGQPDAVVLVLRELADDEL